MKQRNEKETTPLNEGVDHTPNRGSTKDHLPPYIRPSVEISYVTLENGIAACSAQVNNSSGEVKEDWGAENEYNNDINF